jgi:aspartyl-tRNA synthetase
MYRTHNCGELRISDLGKEITLAGWIAKNRDLGGMTFTDLRDRYGITQLAFNEEINADLVSQVRKTGREFVVQVKGKVVERSNKNKNISTGEIEVLVSDFTILNPSKTPPFTIENDTDGGEEIRSKYRYLDLRRDSMRAKMQLRHKVGTAIRTYLNAQDFIEVETPCLIKSTPEGARDFVVPSRLNEGQYYALPQSPQTFKQLLMVSGFDKYYQLVKCFRDEDFRADRQPEFTQIDCEMSFVEQEDILSNFEGMMRSILKEVKDIDLPEFPRMTYAYAMEKYGIDKPDLRFGMEINDITILVQNKGFKVFDDAEKIVAIVVEGAATYTRKQLDALTEFVKSQQVGAKGLIYSKVNEDGTFKSSVDKFYKEEEQGKWAAHCGANKGDLILVLSGDTNKVLTQMGRLRLHMGDELGLKKAEDYKPLWVVDFPLLELDEETGNYHAMHHPFTSPKVEDIALMDTDPGAVRANAYDMVLNGMEIGGGSIRIHDRAVQERMFDLLGFTKEEAQKQFGFLMGAFEYGAPPHGGIALGFDRICALLAGVDSIRDVIAFPKNNMGRDEMIDAPSFISDEQKKELGI